MSTSDVHTVLFKKRYWTVPRAKQWLQEHGYISPKVHETANFYRFRQIDPKKFRSFSTVKVTPSIALVIGYY
jgi:hypothetical protein